MTSQFTHYDVFMRMLDVMAMDMESKPRALSAHERGAVTNIIQKLEGSLIVQTQTFEEEVTMTVNGDVYQNISNSVIAARGAIAKGVITVREHSGEDAANALDSLHKAIEGPNFPAEKRGEALELLGEITKKSAPKSVLKMIGTNLKEVLTSAGAIADTVNKAWPVVETFWS